MKEQTMKNNLNILSDVISKTIVLGLSYFDINDQLLKQTKLMGRVIEATEKNGITILLPDKTSHFIIPTDLSAWFIAPSGRYYDKVFAIDLEDPDYLITWDIYQKQSSVDDKQHQWWDWIPRTSSPKVNAPSSSS